MVKTENKWAVYEQETGDHHVMPIEDLKPHVFQSGDRKPS